MATPFKPAFTLRGASAPEAEPAPKAEPTITVVLRGARPPEGGNWTWIMNAAFEMRLGATTLGTYMYLCRRADKDGRCSPSIRRMAVDLAMEPNTVMAATKRLEAAGLVKITRRPYKPHAYQVLIPVGVSNGATPARGVSQSAPRPVSNGTTPGVSNGTTLPGAGVSIGTHEVDVVEDSKRRACESGRAHTACGARTTTATPSGDLSPEPEEEPDLFEAFYETYPRKGAKRLARTEWEEATRTRDPSYLFQMVQFAVNEYRKAPAWREERGKFIPHAHKFLEGELWRKYEHQAQAFFGDAEEPGGQEGES